jgi:hypothetical protein
LGLTEPLRHIDDLGRFAAAADGDDNVSVD